MLSNFPMSQVMDGCIGIFTHVQYVLYWCLQTEVINQGLKELAVLTYLGFKLQTDLQNLTSHQ